MTISDVQALREELREPYTVLDRRHDVYATLDGVMNRLDTLQVLARIEAPDDSRETCIACGRHAATYSYAAASSCEVPDEPVRELSRHGHAYEALYCRACALIHPLVGEVQDERDEMDERVFNDPTPFHLGFNGVHFHYWAETVGGDVDLGPAMSELVRLYCQGGPEWAEEGPAWDRLVTLFHAAC